MRETYERTSQGQRDAGRRLGERLTDVTFWRNELNTELEALVAEAAQLTGIIVIIILIKLLILSLLNYRHQKKCSKSDSRS